MSDLTIGHATPAQHPDPEKLVPSGFITGAFTGTLQFPKAIDPTIVGIRWQARPDGDLVLQFGRAWTRGFERGIDWEDVPVVGGSFA
jgi:hypothetical protein